MTYETRSPLVSVVMPVWNGERYLPEAIDSILSQTFREFELIIVDDGSCDGTRAIITRYAEGDQRIRPLFAPHRGVVETLNAGSEIAKGKYIAHLDHDDIALPERLDQQVKFLESKPRVAVVGTAFQYITATGRRTSAVIYPPADNGTIRQRLRQSNCFCHSAVTMRTDILAQTGGYRRFCTVAQDYDMWLRVADAHELANIPSVLTLYRIHPQQVSLTRLEQQALVGMAVRASTEVRRKTGIDPLEQVDSIDRAIVLGLGITEEEIDACLVTAYINCLSAMPQIGLGKAALTALRDVVTHKSLVSELELNQTERPINS